MIVVARIKARAGEESPMEEALRAMVAKVAEEKGTLVYTLHRSQNDATEFLLYEKYTDADAFKLHASTPYFKEFFATLQPFLEGSPQIEMYSELVGIRE